MSVQTSSSRVTRERPASRKMRRKKLSWRVSVLRVLFWTAVVVIAAIVGTVVVSKIARPFGLYQREANEVRRLERSIAELKRKNRDLEQTIPTLLTKKGIERIARRYGYVRPGEITLIIPPEIPPAGPKKAR